ALAGALALLLPAGAIAAVPSLRDALGIAGVRVERTVDPLPPLRTGALELGRRVVPARAQELVDFALVTPRVAGLEAPDEAYHRVPPAGGALTFVYQPRASGAPAALTRRGLLLTMFRGTNATRAVGKLVGPGTSVERVSVGGEPGVWLAGRPHGVGFTDARGTNWAEMLQLAGDTLLWQRGPLSLRLEGARSKAAALRIARGVR
ncbi:MAG: hypothetical protein Q8O56_11545, partial [Solirubrobacteraceae bacterium]|nr:hypothetical protein [Solirubrobacteraceae bacterium]